MHVPGLGDLTQHDEFDFWWVSDPATVPYVDGCQLQFTLERPLVDGVIDPEFIVAVQHFLQMTSSDRLEATPRVFRNYERSVGTYVNPADEIRIELPDNVWQHVNLRSVLVARSPWDDKSVYVQISGNCDWEDEHGLQLVYHRGQELSRVSASDGCLTGPDDE